MSKEEKKAIETLKGLTVYYDDYSLLDEEEIEENDNINKSIQLMIDLIERLEKELNSLKEIEQAHKTDNGLLRQELDMQIEHNKELENELDKTTDLLSICNKRLENISRKLEITDEHIYGYDYGEIINKIKQEKEKNKELEEKLKITVAIITKGMYPEQNEGDNDFDKQFISKDKLNFILSKLNISDIEPWSTYKIDGKILFDLQELL